MFLILLFFPIIAAAAETLPNPCPPPDSFAQIHQAASDWIKVVEKGREQIAKDNKKDLEAWCAEAKKSGLKMKAQGLQMDIGLGSDIHEKSSYGKGQFADDPLLASIMDQEYLRCFEQEGVCTGVKHFPGIGQITVDPHEGVSPEVLKTEMLMEHEFKPFYSAIRANACSVMSTHVEVKTRSGGSEICTFNPECIQVLRKGLGFDGLIVTDEILVMHSTLHSILASRYAALLPKDEQELKEWKAQTIEDKINFIASARARKECPNSGDCTKVQFQKIMSSTQDTTGVLRTLASIRAGNDLILQFRPPGHQYPVERGLKELISGVAAEAKTDPGLRRNIVDSVRRILRQKQKLFGKALFAKSPEVSSADEMLSKMSLEDQIKQMIVIDGRNGFFSHADQMGLGGVYLPGDQSDKVSKIPMLHLGDHQYEGANASWGARFQKSER